MKRCGHIKKSLQFLVEVKETCPNDLNINGMHFVFKSECEKCQKRNTPDGCNRARGKRKISNYIITQKGDLSSE